MSERVDMDEIKERMKEYEQAEDAAANISDVPKEEKNTESNLPANSLVGITSNVVNDKLARIVYNSDTTKSVTEQIEEAAEVGATVKAVEDESIQEKMASAKGEQLVENVREKAATARADRVKAETAESKAKKEQNEAMLGIFNADKHYPEWFRKIVVAMFTPFYLALLLMIGIPTGVLRFTLDCIDGLLVRYESVDEKRRPKVRVTFWVFLGVACAAAVVLPLLKHFNII